MKRYNKDMSTYIRNFNKEKTKQSFSPESPIPIENLVMYIPNIGGIHDSDIGLLTDCTSHERLSIGQMDLCIPPSGIRFHSDHDQWRKSVQDSKSCVHGIGNVISDSKYLKPTQTLLDDVVNVKKGMKQNCKHESMNKSKEAFVISKNKRDSIPVSAAEKRDLQRKMTKLSSMLNEVDRRYKQYYHQLQIVVSSFDALVGCGASSPYTNLTLQIISSKFRLLKDAIKNQIEVISRRLGKTELNEEGIGISRLRFVDQNVRQLSRLGPMHRHIWRPHKGLPESSVSVLRAWLFEHFLHPYPKDSEKNMLARQTGLTRSQVANWFINARVRLWKPMVEEIYKQESIHVVMDSNSSSSDIPPKVP